MAIKHRVSWPDPIGEKTTPQMTAVVQDEHDASIPAASLTTLTLTLYDRATGSLLGGRAAGQNVLNQNGVTVDASGNLVWQPTVTDHQILGTGPLEMHVALFEYTWAAGAKRAYTEITFPVENQTKVT